MTEFLTSDLIEARHGFFSRVGGVSDGLYKGLNCGFGSEDARENVAQNRARVAQAMQVEMIASVYQHHSAEVVVVSADHDPSTKADAMVTQEIGVGLGIITADCAPVVFADKVAGVIGAAHAGWKGAFGGVLENTIATMVRLGATREAICAAVGPCISQQNYEVGEEFFERFLDEDPHNARFFTHAPSGSYLFDLPSFTLASLRGAGVGAAEWVGACTYADEGRYFSYRRTTHRNEPDYGRLISVICL